MSEAEKCPCCSGKTYEECCEGIIKGIRKAATPEELMRSRYTAYAKAEVDHIIESTYPSERDSNDREEIRNWAVKSEWKALTILSTEKGGPDDEVGFVEFKADYADHGVSLEHHELAEFRRSKGEWFFYDGRMIGREPYVRTEPKIGRNDPCPCGSSKKYKKCCGK